MANQFQFIAIEGVIGAGKTALANLLSERHQARMILEEFEENPFLERFYKDAISVFGQPIQATTTNPYPGSVS